MPKKKEKNLSRPSPAKVAAGDISVDEQISAPAKQLFNILLRNAFQPEEPPSNSASDKMETEYEVSIKELIKEIPGVKTPKQLRETLDSLCVKIRYDAAVGGETRRGFFIMLPQVELDEERRVCRYAFSPRMLALMTDPSFSAKMSLLLRRLYKGGEYGRLIYELCFEHKEVGQTPFISIDKLKGYLGVGKDAYPEFKIFNRDLLKPAIKEINSQTDLNLTLNSRRTGRKITHLGFSVEAKSVFRPASFFAFSSVLSKKRDEAETTKKLISLGVSKRLVRRLTPFYSQRYLKLAAEVLAKLGEKNRNDSTIKEPDALLYKIIRLGQRRLTAEQTPADQKREQISVGKINVDYKRMTQKIRRLSGEGRKAFKEILRRGGFGK